MGLNLKGGTYPRCIYPITEDAAMTTLYVALVLDKLHNDQELAVYLGWTHYHRETIIHFLVDVSLYWKEPFVLRD